MDTGDRISRLLRATAYTGGGQRIGPIAAVYLDDAGRPAWVSILVDPGGPGPGSGSGSVERLAPLARAWLYPGHRLVMTVIRRAVEAAPIAPPAHLGTDAEDLLVRYYAHAITPTTGRTPTAPAFDAVLPRALNPSSIRLRRVTSPAVGTSLLDPHETESPRAPDTAAAQEANGS